MGELLIDRAGNSDEPKLAFGAMVVWALLLSPASLLLLLALSSVGLPWTFLAGIGLVLVWGLFELVGGIRKRQRNTGEDPRGE